MSHLALTSSIATGLVVAAAAVLVAGPLNPPAGPVASSYKTLSEVEPRIAVNATNTPGDATSLFKITQPGSYYLTGNITGVAGKHGIAIAVSGVTLDLGGFDLVGVPGMAAFDGVRITVLDLTNIRVTNGSVLKWGGSGLNFAFSAFNSRVEGVLASGNAGAGISVGPTTTVSNCSAYNNAASGITTSTGCVVTGCTTYGNTSTGISANSGSTVTNCSAYLNTASGIAVTTNCIISNCSASFNTGNGIATLDGCAVSACGATNNGACGINTSNGCQVSACTTRNNQADGISVNFACTVSGSTCNGDGLAAGNQGGIRVLGQANRIEANNVTYADRGLLVDAAGNVIVRNVVKGCNVNWDIAANNACGPILDRTAPASAAISGNSAPSSLGTTDPNANFSY